MEILEVSLERDQAGSRSASGCEFDPVGAHTGRAADLSPPTPSSL